MKKKRRTTRGQQKGDLSPASDAPTPPPHLHDTVHASGSGVWRLARQGWVQFAALALAILFTYGHTLDVPFYFDDRLSIHENPALRSLDPEKLLHYAPLRIVGYATLALNYGLNDLHPAGYHVVNILIHLLAGGAVLLLVRGLMRTPAVAGSRPGDSLSESRFTVWLPFLTALLFVIHPLQTQAITYIVQRLASLTAALYLCSLACYVRARLGTTPRQRWSFGIAAFLAGLLALFTKQNAFTLPLALLLLEFFFYPAYKKRLLLIAAGITAGLAGAYFFLSLLIGYHPFSFEALQALTRETTGLSRLEYLATQATVLWTYIKLFFIPIDLHLDYDILLARNFADPVALAAGLAHVGLIVTAFLLSRRWPFIAFGILFYYLAHLVESSLIPIRDVVFEHRTYLPNFGLCLMTVALVLRMGTSLQKQKTAIWFLAAVFLLLAVLTYQRNQVWRDPLLFWRNEVNLSPGKSRPHNELGLALLAAGRLEEATNQLNRAVAIEPANAKAHNNLGLVLLRRKEIDQAIDHFSKAVALAPGLARARNNLGLALLEKGDVGRARSAFETALRINPDFAEAAKNLGLALQAGGTPDKAEDQYRRILSATGESADVHNNLGLVLLKQQKLAEAIHHFTRALQLDPSLAEAENNLGLALGQAGRLQEAVSHFNRALEISPAYAEAHNNLGVAYYQMGRTDRAVHHFRQAVQLDPGHARARRNLMNLTGKQKAVSGEQ